MSEFLLNEVCELIVDCPHTTAKDEGEGFPLVRTPNIGKGRLVYDGMHRVCEDVYNKRNARAIPQENDLIFAREATAGNVALIQKGEKVCLGQRTVLLRPNKALVNPTFLTYFLLAPKQQYNLLCTANGATVAHVNMSTIRNLKLELPHLQIQNKIGMILSRYDSLIENYQKQIKLLEESAQRLYKEWFIDLRFPGHENTKIVDGVPEGWEKKKIKDLVDLKSGYAFKSSAFVEKGKYKIVTIKNVKDGVFDGDNVSYLNSVPEKMPSHCILQTGDILLSLTGNVGRICMVVGDNYLLNQRVAKLESKFPAFTYCLFRHYDTFVAINNLANGAAQQNVSPIRIGEMDMLVANDKIMHHFEKAAENIRTNILNLFSQIRHLTEARDRLLPKLMSGEINVEGQRPERPTSS